MHDAPRDISVAFSIQVISGIKEGLCIRNVTAAPLWCFHLVAGNLTTPPDPGFRKWGGGGGVRVTVNY